MAGLAGRHRSAIPPGMARTEVAVSTVGATTPLLDLYPVGVGCVGTSFLALCPIGGRVWYRTPLPAHRVAREAALANAPFAVVIARPVAGSARGESFSPDLFSVPMDIVEAVLPAIGEEPVHRA